MPSFVAAAIVGGFAAGIAYAAPVYAVGGVLLSGAGLAFTGFSWAAFASSLVLGGLSNELPKKPR